MHCWAFLADYQVRAKVVALRARRAELASAITYLARTASAHRTGRNGDVSAFVGISIAGAADAAAASGGGDVTLASVMRSLKQVRRLSEQFDRRWGFARDHSLGAVLEVRACVCMCTYNR